VRDLSRLLAPVLSFTSEEVWRSIPRSGDDPPSVFLAGLPEAVDEGPEDGALASDLDVLLDVRGAVTQALEKEREEGRIGKSLEAAIRIDAGPDHEVLARHADLLPDLFIVSGVDLHEGGDGLAVTVRRADGSRCERCWKYTHDVGEDGDHPTLCARCASVVKQDEAG